MDIFNRPPSISEDTLLYVLHPPTSLADKPSSTSLAACIHDFVQNLLPDFLWHRDPFQLKVVSDPDVRHGEDKYVLEGRMRVGDCVDDEWCVVWLLRELSKQWDIVISVSDSDGEFLLIEAAESLPSWVNPSNATNRVWIHSGRLHLIPLSYVSAPSKSRRRHRVPDSRGFEEEHVFGEEDDGYIAVDDALPLVQDASVDTFAPEAVENIVWQRIAGYPGATRNHVHTTKAYLPIDIAHALAVDPSLIQKPIETFYTRDAIQLRAAHKMARFTPRPDVLRSVKMTRTAYAQLLGQKFYPPKIFGRFEEMEGTDAWRWRDIGMKLACGFEMLFQESKNRADVVMATAEAQFASAEARKDALRRSPEYKAYLTCLVTVGYFRDEVEGSQLWSELEDKAADAYMEVRREDDVSRPSFAALFNSALSRAPARLPETDMMQTEDSDEWLNIDAKDFDEVLERATQAGDPSVKTEGKVTDGERAEDRIAKEQTDKLRDLATKVEQFVEGKGDIEGARFEDEASSDEDGGDSDDENDILSDDNFFESDEEESDTEPRKATDRARQQAMDNLIPPLPPSEYGQMPASFMINTQRVAKATVLTDTIEIAPSVATLGITEAAMPVKPGPQPHTRPIRPPIFPRDEYEGADSDDESSPSDQEGESEEDMPQVVGEIEVDMNEEEAEFLEFSRQALGISDEMWDEIIEDRRGRGAFVPNSVKTTKDKPVTETSKLSTAMPSSPPDPQANKNPDLDSFEAVMQAMDAELSRLRQPTGAPRLQKFHPRSPPRSQDKGKARAEHSDVDVDMDIETAMDDELERMLEREDVGDSDEESREPSMDYNLIKNFLESFKGQAGLPGPVGNLVGRLQPGWTVPRDES